MRYFFDSSSLAKRFHREAGSEIVNQIFVEPTRAIYVSQLAVVELVSVAGVKRRTGSITANEAEAFLRQARLSAATRDFEVQQLKRQDYLIASQLLGNYAPYRGLKTLDAIHLAAALRHNTISKLDFFVTSDKTLAEIATLENLAVIVPK